MKLVCAHNWDPALIPTAERFGVWELFAKLGADPVGGGRPSIILRSVSRREAARQIRRIQAAGIRFNYLLNGMGLGKREITRPWRRSLHELLDWIHDVGVRAVTVSTPYMGSVVRERYPDIDIVVSTFAGVSSVEQAARWEALGATTVIVYDTKDFELIRAIRRRTGLEVEVTANQWCGRSCYRRFHHATADTASSLDNALHGEYMLPLCETRCSYERYEEPRRILAANWMRPEDVGFYEQVGVSRLKVLDRSSSTADLARAIEAYATRRYDGNVADLIPGFNRERYDTGFAPRRLARMVRAFLRPNLLDIQRAREFQQRCRPPHVEIRSAELDGFLEGLARRKCRLQDCETCGFCDEWAQRAIHFDEAARVRYLQGMRQNLADLDGGRLFDRRAGERTVVPEWTPALSARDERAPRVVTTHTTHGLSQVRPTDPDPDASSAGVAPDGRNGSGLRSVSLG